MQATQTQLIPIQEMTPGAVGAIRNQVINNLVAQVSRELGLPADKLVVRDIRPLLDLAMYGEAAATATSERWGYVATGTTIGFTTVTGAGTMGDQRYVAIYGVRDRGIMRGASGSATISSATAAIGIASPGGYKQVISLIKINVGGADKVIWDISGVRAYTDAAVAFSPSAVVIPQNASFNIYYYRQGSIEVGIETAPVTDEICWLQLVGVTVEPRGKVISP